MQRVATLVSTGIGKKALVAITGAMLFGFLVIHLLGNLQVFLGADAINGYSETLHSMPKLVWGARLTLLAALIVHMALTIDLAMRNRGARKTPYRVQADAHDEMVLVRYARKTMVISGPIIAAYVVFHLAHLTAGTTPLPFEHLHPYENMVYGFRDPIVSGTYIFANLLLGFHLFHGGQSLFASLGFAHSEYDARVRGAALGLAAFITVGNVLIPVSVLLRLVGGELP